MGGGTLGVSDGRGGRGGRDGEEESERDVALGEGERPSVKPGNGSVLKRPRAQRPPATDARPRQSAHDAKRAITRHVTSHNNAVTVTQAQAPAHGSTPHIDRTARSGTHLRRLRLRR